MENVRLEVDSLLWDPLFLGDCSVEYRISINKNEPISVSDPWYDIDDLDVLRTCDVIEITAVVNGVEGMPVVIIYTGSRLYGTYVLLHNIYLTYLLRSFLYTRCI